MGERSSGPDLDVWLAPFLAAMGRETRRTWAPLYLRGLLGPGDRKSLQPMAARLAKPGIGDDGIPDAAARPGTTAHSGQSWLAPRTGWSADPMPAW